MNRLLRLAACGCLAAGLASGVAHAQGAKEVRIAVVTHGQASDPYWSVVKRGVDDGAKMTGAKVEYNAPDTFDMVQMAHMIDAAVASRPDGLVVSVPDEAALHDSITRAIQAGIPVISIDAGEEAAKRMGVTLFVGSESSYKAGQVAGQRLLKDHVLKVVCVNQEVGNTSLDDRCRGITDVLKPQGGSTDVLAVTMDPTDVTSRAQAYLSSHPDIQGVVALGASTVGDPLVGLFRQRGLFGKVGLYTFDISPTTLEAVAKKEMGFALDAQEYLQGFYPVVTLYERALYGFWPTSDIRTGPRVIDEPAQAEKVLDMSKLGVR